ncbi:MAG TPA: hypothetical protein VE889_03125 [Actinomycetota bacterium]|nr:hypothetical protein [Actinomycetota bacterium]
MKSERGLALIEALLLGLVLIVPLIWVLGVLSSVHQGALAATSAAREAGVDAARARDLEGASRAVETAVARAFVDHGLDPSEAVVRFSAAPRLARGGTVQVVVRYPVEVISAPLLGEIGGPAVWVDARNVTRIEPYGSR